jgi:hypothetical protein
VPVKKVLVEQPTSEPKVKAYIAIYEAAASRETQRMRQSQGGNQNKSGVRLNSACTSSKLKELRGGMPDYSIEKESIEILNIYQTMSENREIQVKNRCSQCHSGHTRVYLHHTQKHHAVPGRENEKCPRKSKKNLAKCISRVLQLW